MKIDFDDKTVYNNIFFTKTKRSIYSGKEKNRSGGRVRSF